MRGDLAFTAELVERGLYKLAREIALKHHTTVEEIGSELRLRHVVNARREFIIALRGMGLSYPAIGVILRRDHSTVMQQARIRVREAKS